MRHGYLRLSGNIKGEAGGPAALLSGGRVRLALNMTTVIPVIHTEQ